MTITLDQLELLKSFANDLQLKGTTDKRLFAYWAERLDSAKVGFAAQNWTFDYYATNSFKDVYLTTFLTSKGFVIQ